MTDPVIEITGLSRHFGRQAALDRVSLSVPRGCVLGLVGVNGSGKTTLLRHVLGQYRAEGGTVRVFGLDPVADPVGVLSRVGFLSDDFGPDESRWPFTRQAIAEFFRSEARHLVCQDT